MNVNVANSKEWTVQADEWNKEVLGFYFRFP